MPETTAGGVCIRYDDIGRGEPLLLGLTGWCASRRHFAAMAHELAPRRRVITLDWRGHGESAKPSADFGAADLVEDAAAVIAASGARRIVPIATAHAGWVAIELRRRLGDRIPKIILLDWIVLDPPPPFLGALGAMQDPASCQQTVDQLFSMWIGTSTHKAVADFIRNDMGSYGTDMWARAGREIGAAYGREGNPLKALAALPSPPPVLHLYAVPKDEGYLAAQHAFAKDHPWFQVRRLDTLTHFPTLESPQTVAAAVDSFVG